MSEQSEPSQASGLDHPATHSSDINNRLSLLQYYEEGDIDNLRAQIQQSIEKKTFNTHELIELAKGSKESAALVKELIHVYKIDETELADRIANEILCDIEAYTNLHLQKYDDKFTLNAPQLTSKIDGSKAKFFNLISLLKDVSILGRKLLETSPRYDSSKPRPASQATSPVPSQVDKPTCDQDKYRLRQQQQQQNNKDSKSQMSNEEDATSDDLLAALIESSSTDDFLVLSSSLDSITIRDMMIAVLVIITSHECFTLSHDIQGVAMVLRRAKFLIKNILAPKNQMELVARLLTAISRFNEMNYVFDLFRDRNQFEILLSKGVEKTPGLRIALYNYVKKNPEFYALVTLNFSMFREIAESLEASATNRLKRTVQLGKAKEAKARKKVSSILASGIETSTAPFEHSNLQTQHLEASVREPARLTDSTTIRKSNSIEANLSGAAANSHANQKFPEAESGLGGGIETSGRPLYSRDPLQLCLVELVDASDCFARAGCYKRSNDCANKAKLVALQLALLFDEEGGACKSAQVNVLDLKQTELADLIVNLEYFSDAYIVAQAYDYHHTWRQALFRNVVLRGQLRYLDEYCSECDLSETLIMELVVLYRQYLASNQVGHEGSARLGAAMKSILKHLKRVALKCQLYNEFQFNDAKEELLKNVSVHAYLRDLKLVTN